MTHVNNNLCEQTIRQNRNSANPVDLPPDNCSVKVNVLKHHTVMHYQQIHVDAINEGAFNNKGAFIYKGLYL